jgi:hypothetical protein
MMDSTWGSWAVGRRPRAWGPSLWAAFLFITTFLFSGCSPIQWYARQSGKGAVRGFYEGVADVDEGTRRRVMSEVLGDPALRQMAHDVASSIVTGVVDGVAQAKLDRLTNNMVKSTLDTLRTEGDTAMAQFVDRTGPLLERALRRGVEDAVLAMGSALHHSAQTDMGAATTLLMRAAVDGAVQSLRRSSVELGHDLDANTERFLTQRVAPGVGYIAHTFTREAVLGLQEGLTQSGMKDQMPALRLVMHEIGLGLGEGLGVGFGRSVQKAPLEPVLIGIAVVLALLLVGSVLWLVLLWRRYSNTSQSLALFAQELEEASTSEARNVRDVAQAIRDAHITANQMAFLEKFLKRRGLYPHGEHVRLSPSTTSAGGGAGNGAGRPGGVPSPSAPPTPSSPGSPFHH